MSSWFIAAWLLCMDHSTLCQRVGKREAYGCAYVPGWQIEVCDAAFEAAETQLHIRENICEHENSGDTTQ